MMPVVDWELALDKCLTVGVLRAIHTTVKTGSGLIKKGLDSVFFFGTGAIAAYTSK